VASNPSQSVERCDALLQVVRCGRRRGAAWRALGIRRQRAAFKAGAALL